MKNLQLVGLVLFTIILTVGCTEEQRAKKLGGDMTVNIKCGYKLFDVTWKTNNLWYVVRPMRPDDAPEIFTFIEQSSFNILEGTVTFNESRCQ